jgi:peptidoglycan/xylan/chitin deacetylase (PgdA/CDA1 family)
VIVGGSVITTSWDDGHPCDLRLADLLDRHGMAATFYMPVRNPERPVLTASEIRSLAARFEIGAHTLNHRRLAGLATATMRTEIVAGREALEDMVGRSVTAFCYPGGKFSRRARVEVDQAGFVVARTTMAFRTDWEVDRLLLPTSGQAFPHGAAAHLGHAVKERNWRGATNYVVKYMRSGRDWVRLAIGLLDQAVAAGGWWHLWGHSWELEDLGAWNDLAVVLREAHSSGVRSVSNTQLARVTRQVGA